MSNPVNRSWSCRSSWTPGLPCSMDAPSIVALTDQTPGTTAYLTSPPRPCQPRSPLLSGDYAEEALCLRCQTQTPQQPCWILRLREWRTLCSHSHGSSGRLLDGLRSASLLSKFYNSWLPAPTSSTSIFSPMQPKEHQGATQSCQTQCLGQFQGRGRLWHETSALL